MKYVLRFIILFLLVPPLWAQDFRPDREHTEWIAHVMQTIDAVKTGMTRADLLKVFTGEGGLSTRLQRTYVYKACPYIKVTFGFKPVENTNSRFEMPTDRIVSISRPFLQYTVAD
jgi:hypothetical protein